MKTGLICLCAFVSIGLVLVAGCTSSPGTPGTSVAGAGGNAAVDQDNGTTLVNGTYAFNASIYAITATALPSGGHQVKYFRHGDQCGKNALPAAVVQHPDQCRRRLVWGYRYFPWRDRGRDPCARAGNPGDRAGLHHY